MSEDQNQYDFIMNPGQPSVKDKLFSKLPVPGGKKQRFILAIAGAVLLIAILSLGGWLLSLSGNAEKERLTALAQQHTEIIRIAEIGIDKATDPAVRNFASTTKLALQSSQAQLNDVVSKVQKVDNKLLRAGQDPKTDESLTTAEQRNLFDDVFKSILTAELRQYQAQLMTAYDASSSDANKQVYSNIYNQVTALIPKQPNQ